MDRVYGFAFLHPRAWYVAQPDQKPGGKQTSYVLPIAVPGGRTAVSVRLHIGSVRYEATPIRGTRKQGGVTLRYHHLQVDRHPAVEIDRITAEGVKRVDTNVNGPRYSYDLRIETSGPPIGQDALVSYSSLVRTFRITAKSRR